LLMAFVTPAERQAAWLSLPTPEKVKSVVDSLDSILHYGGDLRPEARRMVLREWSESIKSAHQGQIYSDPTDLFNYAMGLLDYGLNRHGSSATTIEDKVVELAFEKSVEFLQQDTAQNLRARRFWTLFDLPPLALIRTMSEDRLQSFLRHVLKRGFLRIRSEDELWKRKSDWKDEYRRKCFRFLDPMHPDWESFEKELKSQSSGPHELELAQKLYQEIMQDLTRPPSLAGPAGASNFVQRLHAQYDRPGALSYAL